MRHPTSHRFLKKENLMPTITKPIYLYHGSPCLFPTVEPRTACGDGVTQTDMLTGIYAYEKFSWVIPFALPIRWYPDEPGGKRSFSCEAGKTYLDYGTLNPDGVGDVYRLPADCFERVDENQWLSRVPVTPDCIIPIRVRDYLPAITFSPQAQKLQNLLYGTKEQGAT